MRRIALLLTAAIGTVTLLAFFYSGIMVNAAEVATRVQGEAFNTRPPTGTSIATDTTLYSNGQALKFNQNVMASHRTVTCTAECNVQVMARGGQSGGESTLSVNGSTPQAITNNGAPQAYLFEVNLPAGSPNTISITAGNTGKGRNPFVDLVSFPASDGGGTDTTSPTVTITSGPGDTSDGAADFTFSADEPATFECKLLQGTTTISNWAGCTSPPGKTYPGLADGDYRFRVRATDSSNNVSAVRSRTFTVTNGGGGGESEILVGAGDISTGGTRDQQTGNLIRNQLSAGAWGVFTTGDNAYPDGTYLNYGVYDAAWGGTFQSETGVKSVKSVTRPTYGNHDYYDSETALGSEQYWNEAPATPVQVSNAKSFYAYDVGNSNWRAIVLNSASSEGPRGNLAPSCTDGTNGTVLSDQIKFLKNELNTSRSTGKHTVLFWHHARFSKSSSHDTLEGDDGCSRIFYDVAHDTGADLVMEGHSHDYERYQSRDKNGNQTASGLTSIVCGTGGNSFDGLSGTGPAADRSFTNAWGICKLTLNANNAQVNFLAAPGSPGADSATVPVRP